MCRIEQVEVNDSRNPLDAHLRIFEPHPFYISGATLRPLLSSISNMQVTGKT